MHDEQFLLKRIARPRRSMAFDLWERIGFGSYCLHTCKRYAVRVKLALFSKHDSCLRM